MTRTAAAYPPLTPAPTHSAVSARPCWRGRCLGAGLATGVVAGVLYGLGASQGARAHEAYLAASDPDEILRRWDEVETAQTRVVAGHVLAGVTALAVGLAIYQFVTRPGLPPPAPAGLGASLGPTPGASGATLWLRGSF